MNHYKLNYNFSRDYDLMKWLLDNGFELVCYIDFDWRRDGTDIVRDVCRARKTPNGNYYLSVRGHGYRDYAPFFHKYSFAEAMLADNVEFIVPNDYEKDNVQ